MLKGPNCSGATLSIGAKSADPGYLMLGHTHSTNIHIRNAHTHTHTHTLHHSPVEAQEAQVCPEEKMGSALELFVAGPFALLRLLSPL